MDTVARRSPLPKRERVITRLVAFFLGLLLAVGAPASVLFRSNQRLELTHASTGLLAAFLVVCLVCAAVGTVFISVGIKGSLPSWLAKRH